MWTIKLFMCKDLEVYASACTFMRHALGGWMTFDFNRKMVCIRKTGAWMMKAFMG